MCLCVYTSNLKRSALCELREDTQEAMFWSVDSLIVPEDKDRRKLEGMSEEDLIGRRAYHCFTT